MNEDKKLWWISQSKSNPNWAYIPIHPFKILTNSGSVAGKAYVLLLLTKHEQPKFEKNLFTHQKTSIPIKVSITYQWNIKGRDQRWKNPKTPTYY